MGTVINKYRSYIYTYCLKSLRNQFLADEIASEACYRYWIKYTDTKTEQEAKTLLYNIAKNIMIDGSRRKVVQDNHLRSVTTVQAPEADITDKKIFLEMIHTNCKKGVIRVNECEMVIFDILREMKVDPKNNEEIAEESGLGLDKVVNPKKTLFRKIRSFYSNEEDKY